MRGSTLTLTLTLTPTLTFPGARLNFADDRTPPRLDIRLPANLGAELTRGTGASDPTRAGGPGSRADSYLNTCKTCESAVGPGSRTQGIASSSVADCVCQSGFYAIPGGRVRTLPGRRDLRGPGGRTARAEARVLARQRCDPEHPPLRAIPG